MRRTCFGSHRKPDGEPLQLPGRQLLTGLCTECGGVYAIRVDGTVHMHREDSWDRPAVGADITTMRRNG